MVNGWRFACCLLKLHTGLLALCPCTPCDGTTVHQVRPIASRVRQPTCRHHECCLHDSCFMQEMVLSAVLFDIALLPACPDACASQQPCSGMLSLHWRQDAVNHSLHFVFCCTPEQLSTAERGSVARPLAGSCAGGHKHVQAPVWQQCKSPCRHTCMSACSVRAL